MKLVQDDPLKGFSSRISELWDGLLSYLRYILLIKEIIWVNAGWPPSAPSWLPPLMSGGRVRTWTWRSSSWCGKTVACCETSGSTAPPALAASPSWFPWQQPPLLLFLLFLKLAPVEGAGGDDGEIKQAMSIRLSVSQGKKKSFGKLGWKLDLAILLSGLQRRMRREIQM